MKKIQQLLLLSVITLGILTACGSGGEKKAEGGEHGTEAATEGGEHAAAPTAGSIQVDAAKLAGLKDVVCGMELKAEALGDTLTHEGKLHGFCSAKCKEEFLKDPKKYTSAH